MRDYFPKKYLIPAFFASTVFMSGCASHKLELVKDHDNVPNEEEFVDDLESRSLGLYDRFDSEKEIKPMGIIADNSFSTIKQNPLRFRVKTHKE